MTNPTVPTTETTGELSAKDANKLKVGDWIVAGQLDNIDTTAEVVSAHPYDDRVLLVVTPVGGYPIARSIYGPQSMLLATDAQVEVAKAATYRIAAARALIEIAELFQIHGTLPLPDPCYGLHVSISCDTAAEVKLAGDLLGVEPVVSGNNVIVRFPNPPADTPRYLFHSPASITWTAYEKPAPVAEAQVDQPLDTGLDYSREPDAPTAAPIPAGVDGLKVGGRVNGKARRP